MQDVNVVVIFCASHSSGERSALAAGLGAVQAKANIRMRRLAPANHATPIATPVMDDEYIAPREMDATWADAFLIVMPPDSDAPVRELAAFFDLLENLRAEGKFHAVAVSALAADSRPASLDTVDTLLSLAGLVSIPVDANPDRQEQARLQGHRIVEAVRDLKR